MADGETGAWVSAAVHACGALSQRIAAITDDLRRANRGSFGKLPPEEQDAYLRPSRRRSRDLGGVPSDVFFESLLEITIEGYFCDPVYGGNKDMVSGS